MIKLASNWARRDRRAPHENGSLRRRTLVHFLPSAAARKRDMAKKLRRKHW